MSAKCSRFGFDQKSVHFYVTQPKVKTITSSHENLIFSKMFRLKLLIYRQFSFNYHTLKLSYFFIDRGDIHKCVCVRVWVVFIILYVCSKKKFFGELKKIFGWVSTTINSTWCVSRTHQLPDMMPLYWRCVNLTFACTQNQLNKDCMGFPH